MFPGTSWLADSNLGAQEKKEREKVRNTLDKLESRLSARLPRIMDVTVTHVNEARHLHLLHHHLLPVSPLMAAGKRIPMAGFPAAFHSIQTPTRRINIRKDERWR